MKNPELTLPFEIAEISIKNHDLFDDITLKFSNPGFNLIIGENGSGKSTLLNLLSFHYDTHSPLTNYLVSSNLGVVFNLVSTGTEAIFTLYDEQEQAYPGHEIQKVAQNIKLVRPIINHDSTNDIGMKSHNDFQKEIADKLKSKDGLLKEINAILADNNIDRFIEIDENTNELIYGSDRKLYGGLFKNESGNLSSGQYYLLKILIESLSESKILLIEEPEISLHPEWQEKIIDILRHPSIGDKQIFIVVQSPYIFNKHLADVDIKLFTLERGNGKSKISSLVSFQFDWQRSYNGINYHIFNIVSNEYHIELYNSIMIEANINEIKRTDTFIKASSSYDAAYERITDYGKTKYYTLPTFIRNEIHHPKNGYTFNDVDLRTSIELMIKILEN
tara:strand:- start:101 stop:1270 length:1170 start_codon:yes stop_codon:yes gene_type:complete